MGKVAGICKKNVKSGRHKRALARACHWTLDRQWFVMTPGVFTSFFRSVSRAFFRVKIAAAVQWRMAQKVKKKSCENLVRCWSTEDEIVTLIKVNDYGYEGGFSLLCSGANDHIFSRQKAEWNECLSWFLCFNSYLMPYLIVNSRLDLIPKNSWIFWHLLNDKSKNRFEFLRSLVDAIDLRFFFLQKIQ